MTRTLNALGMGLLLLATASLPSHAVAGGLLVSGGFSAMPSDLLPQLFVPDWRLGYGTDRFAVWGTVPFASFLGEFEEYDESLSGWATQPRVGAWWNLDPREPGSSTPYLAGSLYTRLGGYSYEDDGIEEEDMIEDLEVKRFLGASLGVGLEAMVTEGLTVSTEVGLDAYSLKFMDDSAGFEANTLNVYGALFLNLWI